MSDDIHAQLTERIGFGKLSAGPPPAIAVTALRRRESTVSSGVAESAQIAGPPAEHGTLPQDASGVASATEVALKLAARQQDFRPLAERFREASK